MTAEGTRHGHSKNQIESCAAAAEPSRPVKFILIVNILKVLIELLYKQVGAPTVPSAVIKCQFSYISFHVFLGHFMSYRHFMSFHVISCHFL
jgi:hypothetical protein